MIFFILANSAIIVPQNVKYCNYTDIDSCINDLGCGWCENNDSSIQNCTYVGVCGSYFNTDETLQCKTITHSHFCNLLGFLTFLILLGATISTSACAGIVINYCFKNENTLSCLIKMILSFSYGVAPILVFYYLNYVIFVIVLFSQLLFTILFWSYYGGEKVRRSFKNKMYNVEINTETNFENQGLLQND